MFLQLHEPHHSAECDDGASTSVVYIRDVGGVPRRHAALVQAVFSVERDEATAGRLHLLLCVYHVDIQVIFLTIVSAESILAAKSWKNIQLFQNVASEIND